MNVDLGVATGFTGKTALYDLVTDEILNGNYDAAKISNSKRTQINNVINAGGIYLIKDGEGYKLTDEAAKIMSVEYADGVEVEVLVSDAQLQSGESFLLEEVMIEFVPEYAVEKVSVSDVEAALDFEEVM